MQILSGKELAKQELAKLKQEIIDLDLERKLRMAIIQVGDNAASNKYIAHKLRVAEDLGIEAELFKFDEDISQDRLLKKMDRINEKFDGIIVQLPLPSHLPTQVILDAVPYDKDIDGLTTKNEFRLYNDTADKHFIPATARGVLELMEHYGIDVENKRVCVVGRSHVVGKPLAHIIKRKNANVSTYNEETGIKGIENADILIVAIGVAKYIKAHNVKEGAIVIDVGTNLDDKLSAELSGDVDFEDVKDKVAAITPVPGGVGPMTVVALMKNLVDIVK
ncbi:bifunctional 5,10-methylenetetrahydrofolate dehydrogenase/5,10-methenyltetrahydrofolate cyclohydrolase [Mycoplasma sp. 2045]|uniref:bifunctional 5,10-methylenetetrahydrofolate dehydrogenase/5,10-methenyltetrahydrofolate cyclohydrolase n=1 Tax=unclassified Mycoplasma TaxID=2683645 RepID=UPI00211C4A72|nr:MULTISPECIES: bifunctional 5,10-methylenetetrahydrofolate dehydrogenase/5,10-methenyltetrahydrofolate cyclohydrolase [unclassified Mycoplasma]MEA4134541.1 bifunctional 5,10-methylenetetrahydrofolate dehydrogenase/5,10-methenyltetrahydrofolate cyclohydrolase [Mycoplasma sp. 2704]MEA4276495.1 bifunctional 5,10-methylenetetrahydrofolate dehydrogenase/5,10-methenyltetrahydrofolate cyclohydrolase [Mycoplasma sp. 21DD0573]MEA4333722.1 bifunctional 5,10-methylenetetrahydrofolate dehydrogenase/5,10-m